MHVSRESASDDDGVSTSRDELIAARSNTTGHNFYASAKTPHRSLADTFLVWFGIFTVAAHPCSYR